MTELPFGLTAAALADALAEPDPDGLAAGSRLRARHGPELAVAALQQASLRRRAKAKFGSAADGLFLTRDGLEQATRPEVARHHAERFRAAGARRVVDLGCGIGSDALAFLDAGLEVVAVERDPVTAAVAAANLAGHAEGRRARVLCADAEEVADALLEPGVAAFCDPARRSAGRRLWQVGDFTPSWSLVTRLLDGDRAAGVKLGPALPHALVPVSAEAEWVTSAGETVEVALWAGPGATPGHNVALLLPADRLVVPRAASRALPTGPVGRYLYEPDGAVIRARGLPLLVEQLSAWLLDPQIAYLSGDTLVRSPFATAFTVREVLPYDVKVLRRWVRTHEVGALEIKKRGLDVDPAELRRALDGRGPGSATLVLSRTPSGAVAVVVDRVAPA